MKRTITLLFITFAMLTNLFASYHIIYIKPNTKVYVDNLQWLSVKNEITDFLKNNILNGDNSYSEEAKKVFQLIKYSDFTPIISSRKIYFSFSNGEIKHTDIPLELYENINNIIETSSIIIVREKYGNYKITRNIVSEGINAYDIILEYSRVENGNWKEIQSTHMKANINKVKMIASYSTTIYKDNSQNIEFILRISGKKYSFFENNEGKNYNLDFGDI